MQKTNGSYFDHEIQVRRKKERKRRIYSRLILTFLIILLLGLGILVLKGIDWIYMVGSKTINTTFSSNDVLSYAGVILGGIFLLISVVWTIRSESNITRHERILSVKPYLVSYKVDLALKDESPSSSSSETNYNIINVIYSVSDKKFNYSYHTPSMLNLRNNNIASVLSALEAYRRFMTFKYIIENIGCGSAVDGKIYFNGNLIDENFGIAVNGKREYNFIIDFGEYYMGLSDRQIDYELENEGFPVSLQIRFFDSISYTKYRQKETFTIHRESNNKYLEIKKWSGLNAPEKIANKDDIIE